MATRNYTFCHLCVVLVLTRNFNEQNIEILENILEIQSLDWSKFILVSINIPKNGDGNHQILVIDENCSLD